MIDRYVFVKLKPEYATDTGRAEVRARSQALASVPGVVAVTIGAPADGATLGAWDLSLVLRFQSRADVDRYLNDPGHEAYYEGFLEPQVQVIKAWNFEV